MGLAWWENRGDAPIGHFARRQSSTRNSFGNEIKLAQARQWLHANLLVQCNR